MWGIVQLPALRLPTLQLQLQLKLQLQLQLQLNRDAAKCAFPLLG